tara:strand:+ start:1514 stop:2020 length:507 start_codon:yes stop_codon:yes gene_type:complete
MKVSTKDLVLDILSEESEDKKDSKPEKKKKNKAGIEASTGSGRFSAGVKEAGALASEDPKQLMKNLGIKSALGSDDMEKVKSILRQAFVGTAAMKKVYTGFSQVTKGLKSGLKVKISAISARDGVKYIYHTLIGSQNAGLLKVDSLIQIENNSGAIIIYQGEKKTWDD